LFFSVRTICIHDRLELVNSCPQFLKKQLTIGKLDNPFAMYTRLKTVLAKRYVLRKRFPALLRALNARASDMWTAFVSDDAGGDGAPTLRLLPQPTTDETPTDARDVVVERVNRLDTAAPLQSQLPIVDAAAFAAERRNDGGGGGGGSNRKATFAFVTYELGALTSGG
jgi:hypothetical protein